MILYEIPLHVLFLFPIFAGISCKTPITNMKGKSDREQGFECIFITGITENGEMIYSSLRN
jgi:hypothetical protein